MSTLSNSTYTHPALIAVPAVLAAIGLTYSPARPAIIAVAGVAALALLFKPLTLALPVSYTHLTLPTSDLV